MACVSVVALLVLAPAGCGGPYTDVPDQAGFALLADLEQTGDAVVRLYAAPTPGFEMLAIHPWFAVKSAAVGGFDRWEVWPVADEPYGHVRVDRLAADADVGTGRPWVVAELRGDAAAAVVEFIRTRSPTYSCRDRYAYFPGPNSNTYVQWVLDGTGWDVLLPPAAIGGCVARACP